MIKTYKFYYPKKPWKKLTLREKLDRVETFGVELAIKVCAFCFPMPWVFYVWTLFWELLALNKIVPSLEDSWNIVFEKFFSSSVEWYFGQVKAFEGLFWLDHQNARPNTNYIVRYPKKPRIGDELSGDLDDPRRANDKPHYKITPEQIERALNPVKSPQRKMYERLTGQDGVKHDFRKIKKRIPESLEELRMRQYEEAEEARWEEEERNERRKVAQEKRAKAKAARQVAKAAKKVEQARLEEEYAKENFAKKALRKWDKVIDDLARRL